jgi:peroxidase
MKRNHSSCVLLPVAIVLLLSGSALAQLDTAFYTQTCPKVEEIVGEEMVRIISAAPSLAGPLLRLHFHDCFVRVSPLATHEAVADAYTTS